MKDLKVGLQLYSVRQALKADFSGTLAKVKGMGYDYVEMAGGYGYHSKKSKAYIIYMNGQVKRGRLNRSSLIEPGCEIVVPMKEKNAAGLQNILSVATTSASLATMIASIANIIK